MEFTAFAAFCLLVCGSHITILATVAHMRGRINRSYMLSTVLVGVMFVVISSAMIFHVVWLQALCGVGVVTGSLGMIVFRRPHPPEALS